MTIVNYDTPSCITRLRQCIVQRQLFSYCIGKIRANYSYCIGKIRAIYSYCIGKYQ